MLQGLATPSAPTLTDSDPSTPAMDSAAIPSWQPVALVQASGQVPVQMWANQSRCRCGPVSAAGANGGAAGCRDQVVPVLSQWERLSKRRGPIGQHTCHDICIYLVGCMPIGTAPTTAYCSTVVSGRSPRSRPPFPLVAFLRLSYCDR
jgi:hypothetical protein